MTFTRPRRRVVAGWRTGDAGSLGENMNEGGTADIHAWAPGRVVKLFKHGFPAELGQQEGRG